MKVRYDGKLYGSLQLDRLQLPYVDIAACAMTSLSDMWSARAWIEHHRNLGVGRFNIHVNDVLPRTEIEARKIKSVPSLHTDLDYLRSQADVKLVEWNYPFKDPNTTRDKINAPLHYARPMEWNSCNERETHGAKVTLFNDMDEFVVTDRSLLELVRSKPAHCRAVHIGHLWVKVKCPCDRNRDCGRSFESLADLQRCEIWKNPNLSMDRKRRTKMIIRTERNDVHDVLNHDLGKPLPLECAVDGNIASFFHVINLRPKVKHASAGKFFDLSKLLDETNIPVDVTKLFGLNAKVQEYQDTGAEVTSSAFNAMPLYITVTTSPTRIKYLPTTLKHIDVSIYGAHIIVNIPESYGTKEEKYPQAPIDELRANPNIIVNIISNDYGPYTKLLPTFDLITDNDAVIISIDDDTRYPLHFIEILMDALNATEFTSVVGLCGVNITSWGLQDACGEQGSVCSPFDVDSPNPVLQKDPEVIIPGFAKRRLTPVHVLKGFTGVAYPRSVVTASMLADMHKWRTTVALEADQLAGLPYDSCLQSDDLVVSAVLHKHNVGRYRVSISNDCREGLAQFEFGFGSDALQLRSYGHVAKYFACARAIDYHMNPSPPVSMTSVVGGLWPGRNFDECTVPHFSSKPIPESSKLRFRWKKWWYREDKSVRSPDCWMKIVQEFDSKVKSTWHCPFEYSLPNVYDVEGVHTVEGVVLHPVSYAFQLNRVPKQLLSVQKDWSVVWPVQAKSRDDPKRGYLFGDEASYYKEYGTSLFAYTYRKGGWDSMRHYEIVCNGGIPYFIDLKSLPNLTMRTFPRSLVSSAMHSRGVNALGTIDHEKVDMQCMMDVRQALHDHCRVNMSTIALAKQFLVSMGRPDAKKILFVNGRNQWEYLTDGLFHGLRSLLGSGVVDVNKRHFMYKCNKEAALRDGFRNYGRGFSYAWSLPDDTTVERKMELIHEQLSTRHFDLVVIGQMHQPKPTKKDWTTSQDITEQLLWAEISSTYSNKEVACIDGLDRHSNRQRKYVLSSAKYCTLFVREIDNYLLDGVETEESKQGAGSPIADEIFEARRVRFNSTFPVSDYSRYQNFEVSRSVRQQSFRSRRSRQRKRVTSLMKK
eukprot:CAMPEP_0182437882 /NCGR_PEP_ID=MMETSP1167-20130531/85344_1 /TAXON_ID=2988 /ORGANISM="Mallomonas Sp, Strain CCMP3275" /LENGTH=1096 /DNA_ID=CAMNT_0024630951 /DNA_START=621 /DNA_END=3911 /DNA_ORIENTATION=+